MVVKILEAASSMRSATEYNETKVNGGQATRIHMENMDADSPCPVRDTFGRYERLNIRSKEVCLHIAISPSGNDSVGDAQAVQIASGLLSSLGYSGQPWVLYRHNDIQREHFHLLSVRVNRMGRKISSFQEGRRCQGALEELSKQMGFTIGRGTPAEEQAANLAPFSLQLKGGAAQQLDSIYRYCLSYRFSSTEQLRLVLRDFNVALRVNRHSITLRGLDSLGKGCTAGLTSKEYLQDMQEALRRSNAEKREEQTAIYAGMLSAVLSQSGSEAQFRHLLSKDMQHYIPHRAKDGRLCGATFIDHRQRMMHDIFEFGHAFSLSMLQNAKDHSWEQSPAESEQASSHFHLDLSFLISSGSNGRGQEKDPTRKKKKPLPGYHL